MSSALAVLGLSGSYRAGGTVDTAVQAVLAGAAQRGATTTFVALRERTIRFCCNCRACTQSERSRLGTCGQQDDMAEIIRQALASNVLVIGSPVNLGSITALTKAFWERLLPTVYWPWGSPYPVARRLPAPADRRAVIVYSSAVPALLARVLGFPARKELRHLARALQARVVDELGIGMAARREPLEISTRDRERAERIGRRLAD